jgi:hypothetical protein
MEKSVLFYHILLFHPLIIRLLLVPLDELSNSYLLHIIESIQSAWAFLEGVEYHIITCAHLGTMMLIS